MGELRSKLKLGRIAFLNVLPVYYPLEAGIIANPFAIVPDVPSKLNELCASGALDISPVSSVEYARRAGLYHILPDLSISSAGEVMSVLLLSGMPIERLSGRTVLASEKSHTSVELLKVLCEQQYGVKPRFKTGTCSDFFSGAAHADAYLAIGDEALRLGRSGVFPHVLDLGSAWFEWTGLPFVFAVWVVRKETIAEKMDRLAGAVEALSSSKRWGLANIGKVCKQAVKTGLLEAREFERYYSRLGFDFNEPEREGLRRFYSCLVRAGELKETPVIDTCTPLASVA